jgi:hypothetical protein
MIILWYIWNGWIIQVRKYLFSSNNKIVFSGMKI